MIKPKTKKSKIIITTAAVAAIIIGLFLIQPVRMLMAMTSMSPLPSREVMTDIYAVNNSYVNLYLFKSGDQYIAFDAGTDAKATQHALDDFGINATDVAAVFLTHTDRDHVAAIPLFLSAEIYMSKSNKDFIDGKRSTRSKDFISMEREYKTLGDGEAINIASAQIQCVFTPGHTNGSASYVVNGKYLFSGDNLNIKDGKAVLFHDAFNMSNDDQEQSIRKLARLKGIEAIFSMHSGYTADFDTAFSEWLE